MSQRHRPPKPLIALVVLALLGAAGYWYWTTTRSTTAAESVASGAVEAREYQVSAVAAGLVSEVLVTEGQTVAAGDPVVKLDATAAQLQVDQANAGVAIAQAGVTKAEDDGDDADIAAATAKLAQAQSMVAAAQVGVDHATVKAPHAGVVVAVTTNVGQVAAPGRTIVTITDPADLYARVFVPETGIGRVAVGDPASARSDVSGKAFDGTVSFIATQAEFTPNNVETAEQRTKLVYEVRVAITDPSATLRPGLPVDVTFR